jgi:hypothetical protein
MRVEPVEIYSDANNAAILRHPARRFPGVLIQGDTLYTLFQAVERIRTTAQAALDEDTAFEVDDLRDRLREFLDHYRAVMLAHGLALPFADPPGE